MNIIRMFDDLTVHHFQEWHRRAYTRIDRIVCHHSVTRVTSSTNGADEQAQLRAMSRNYVNNKEWAGIPYHYSLGPTGQAYKCNPIHKLTWHARNANTVSIGIMLLGNFEKHSPTNEQWDNFVELCRLINRVMPQVKEVIAHRNVKRSRTACPGIWVSDLMLKDIL